MHGEAKNPTVILSGAKDLKQILHCVQNDTGATFRMTRAAFGMTGGKILNDRGARRNDKGAKCTINNNKNIQSVYTKLNKKQ